MKKKLLLIFLLLCVTIAIIIAIIVKVNANKEEQKYVSATGNTAGNLYNGGYFCESSDGHVYFSNPYDYDSLYIMTPSETNINKLISTETRKISVVGKHFYYYQYGSGNGSGFGYIFNTNGIYRADSQKGSNASCINLNADGDFVFCDNYIYYNYTENDKSSLNRMSLDGKKKEKILDYKVNFANAGNGKIYFTDGKKDMYLKMLNTKNNSVTTVLAEDVYMPIVEGNNIYFIDIHNNYSVAVYNTTTMTKTTLDNTRTDIINITDNYIYYQTAGNEPQLKRIRKNGSDMEVVADGAYSDICVTSQYVYFRKFDIHSTMYKTPANGSVNVTNFDAAKEAAKKIALGN